MAWYGRPDFAAYDQFVVSSTYMTLTWKTPKSSGFPYKTELNYCERLDQSPLSLYPMIMNFSYFNATYTANDQYWTNCKTIQLSTQTQYTLTGLIPGKAYRFKVRLTPTTTAGNSLWSDYKIVATDILATYKQNEFSTIYARGIGAKNHNTSVIMIDNSVLLNHSQMRGLYLVVLSRQTLKKVYSGVYDTQMKQSSYVVNSNQQTAFTTFTINSDFTYTETTDMTQIYVNPNEFKVAHQLAQKIREYDSRYFIIIVSQNAWEINFSKELGDVLMSCGAFNIMEFTNQFSPRYGNKTTFRNLNDKDPLTHTNYYHPYVFIGIPGLSPGKGYESLRSNQGFYMSKGNYAYAEIRVRLRFSRLLGLYTFDTYQYMPQNHFMDSYAMIHFAKDRSLQSTFPYHVATNMSAFYNWKTSIYIQDTKIVYYTNATGYYTKADTLYLQPGEYPYRSDYYGNLNSGSGLVWESSKPYYSFVYNYLYSDADKDCQPPYTNFGNINCYNIDIVNPPEILKCYTGLIPYYCPSLSYIVENDFAGYFQ